MKLLTICYRIFEIRCKSKFMIQIFMIIIINFLSSQCRHHRNIFLSYATLRFKRQYLISFDFPPTYLFLEKLFL